MPSPVMVMSFNPLTQDFRARVEGLIGGNPAYYNAANLRRMSVLAAIRDLRGLRAERMVIAIESEAGRALIGPLSLAAALTRAGTIDIVWPDLRLEAFRRANAARSVFFLARDTWRGRRALARSQRTMRQLVDNRAPRQIAAATGSRILYLDGNISLGAPVGGLTGHTAGVIEALVAHGFSVDYGSIKPPATSRQGVTWIRFEPKTLLAVPAELNYYPYSELIEATITDGHRARPWSFIYQRFSLHNFLGPLLGRKLGIPVVVEFNGSEAWAAEHWGKRLTLHTQAQAAERAALVAADLIVTVSDPLVRDLVRHGVTPERIVVYPNCVDPDVFDSARFSPAELAQLRERHGIPRDALVVGFIGTFGQWHGVDFLAARIAELVAEERAWLERHRLHFMLVGDGLKMPAVRRIVCSDSVARFVTLTGLVPQTEAPRYLAAADLLVSPHVPNPDGSEFFGSPTKLFEYMAMERPILASALGQIADVVAGQGATRLGRLAAGAGMQCGLLFEPGNAEDFKRGLRQLVENRELARALAAAARAEVLARYTWKHHVSSILRRMGDFKLLESSMSVGAMAQARTP